jgi:Mrp family chromosome partitioning ATPase
VFRLHLALEAARATEAPLIVQFVGADAGGGTSTIAAAYAAHAARASAARVLLLQCSGQAAVGRDHPARPGVWDVFQAGRPLEEALEISDDEAGFVSMGAQGRLCRAVLDWTAQQSADLAALGSLAHALRRGFALVILDCAPVGGSPLAASLSRIADGTVVVVVAGRTTRRGVQRSISEIASLGGQVVGLVLNRHREWLPAWLR